MLPISAENGSRLQTVCSFSLIQIRQGDTQLADAIDTAEPVEGTISIGFTRLHAQRVSIGGLGLADISVVARIEAVAVQDKDGTLLIGRQALRDALYATAGYQGLTGSLTCDEYGDCGVARFQVTRLDDPETGLEGLGANVVYTYPAGE